MPWGRVDDSHYRHPKIGELDDELRKGCVCLFWMAISWCNDQLTDGRVPTGTVRVLGGQPAEADELVRVGLWEKDGSGYRIHDYLDFNKSKEQVVAEREQRMLAGKARAAQRWGSDSGPLSDPASEALSEPLSDMPSGKDAPVPRTPYPVTPSPAPDARDDEEGPVLTWLARHGCYIAPGNGFHRQVVTAVGSHGAEPMIAALERLAQAGTKNGDTKGFVFKAIDLLNEASRPNLRELGKADREAGESRKRQVAIERTKVRVHEAGYHSEERDPLCPRCKEGAA